jgi:hypothetical protein
LTLTDAMDSAAGFFMPCIVARAPVPRCDGYWSSRPAREPSERHSSRILKNASDPPP